MAGRQTDGYRVCDICGSLFMNFCLHCKKAGLDERVWEIMERYKLNENELIRILSEHISEGSFPALNLAIAMRDMKPTVRSETTIIPGGEIADARDRIAGLLDRLVSARKLVKKSGRE